MKETYVVGDVCWAFVGEEDEAGHIVLSRGTVVAAVVSPHSPIPRYIIEFDGDDFEDWEIRDAYKMTPHPAVMPACVEFSEPTTTIPSVVVGTHLQ